MSLGWRIIVKMTALSRSKSCSSKRRPSFQPSDLYKIRVSVAATGEHIPLLVDAQTGLPIVRPNQFVLVVRRDRCQVATLKTDLAALSVVLAWAKSVALDLHDLFDRGAGLEQAQLVALVEALRSDYRKQSQSKIVPLHRGLVSAGVWANRIATARDYVAWNLGNTLAKCEPGTLRYQHIRERREELIRAFEGRMPRVRTSSGRKGLDAVLKARLFVVTRPDAVENPFQTTVRERNALIMDVLQMLGLRRAELLKLRTAHFRPGPKPALFVERRPDDPDDPRLDQPQVKTRDRQLPLDPALAERIHRYITVERQRIPNAKRSPFLFLSRSGKPLSLAGVNKIFEQICKWHGEFKGQLSPHVLRHTANDDLSVTLEEAGCDAEAARAVRNYLNGWEPNSAQSSTYTRRFVEGRAQEISLAHQRRIFTKVGEQ